METQAAHPLIGLTLTEFADALGSADRAGWRFGSGAGGCARRARWR